METTTNTSSGGVGQEAATTQTQAQNNAPAPSLPDFRGTKHKVKVEDQELEVPYEELLKDYQHKAASNKRFQEAAAMMKHAKAVESLIQQAQQGDLTWLKGLVPEDTIRQWAESELLQHIEYESLSESEKRALKAERERDQYKDKISKQEQKEKQDRLTALQSRAEQELDVEIANAIKDLGHDVKVTPRLVKRIAEQIELSLEEALGDETGGDFKPMPARDATERAFKGFHKDVEEYLNIIPTEKLLQILPPKHREAIRKADVETVQSQLPFGVRKNQRDDEPVDISSVKNDPKAKLKRMTTDEYFKRMDKAILR